MYKFVRSSFVMLLFGVSTALAGGKECVLEPRMLARGCMYHLRVELINEHCSDMHIPDPIKIGHVCAERVRKAGKDINCNEETDAPRLMPKIVGGYCKLGDTLILTDPDVQVPGYIPGSKWSDGFYSQRMLSMFCARTGIKRLDNGDYMCVIDRGL